MRAFHFLFRRGRGLAAAAIAGLALAGCATYPGGGYGDGYGYPDSYGQQYGNQVVGTVQGVDRGYGRIVLTLEDGYYGGREVAVQFDRSTRLYYRGQVYPVEGLERGDVIRADVSGSGNRLYARTIEVVRNVRESGGYYPGYPDSGYGGYGDYQQLRGRVAWVDPRAQVIRLDAGAYGGYGGQMIEVRYDSRTYVDWRGDRYPARDLDPGDVVRIDARRSGNAWFAERIVLESNAGR